MEYDTAALECTSRTFRSDMWQTVCEDAAEECGISEAWFGPVQVTTFESLPDAPVLNAVLGAAEPGAVENGHLEAAIERADSLFVDYRVPVARHRPGMAAAEDWLNRHGFEQGWCTRRYVRDATPPHSPGVPGVRIWEIGEDESDGETMVFDAAPALGLPSQAGSLLFALPTQERWRTYTAELDGRIVSFGSMLLYDGVAEFGLDATLESARGRGCNQALLRERLLAATEAGCHTVFAENDEDGSPGRATAARNLIRSGFLPASVSVNWRRPR